MSAQNHLRILCGLYGAVKPGDFIQEYRLCMGTKLEVESHKDLYTFWGDTVATEIANDLQKQLDTIQKDTKSRPRPLLVNVASQEYFKVIQRGIPVDVQVVECVFLDAGTIKSAFAKRARGLMARYACISGIQSCDDIDKLKAFDYEGYKYAPSKSTDERLVFDRAKPPSATNQAKKKKATVEASVEASSAAAKPPKSIKMEAKQKETKKDTKPKPIKDNKATASSAAHNTRGTKRKLDA